MTDLVIDRLHARATAEQDDAARLRRLLADLTNRRLAESLAATRIPDGVWCVQRLAVPLGWEPTRADSALGREWATAIIDQIAQTLSPANPDVAYYPRRDHAIAELVTELSLGRLRRLWAWRAAGIVLASDPDPRTAPAETVRVVLARNPHAARPCLDRAIKAAGLAAVHRLLGAAGWQHLAALVADADTALRGWLAGGDPIAEPTTAEVAVTEPIAGERVGANSAAPGPIRRLADHIERRSALLAAARRSRLRPDPITIRAWTLLAVTEVEPAALQRPEATGLLTRVAADIAPRLRPAPDLQSGPTPDPDLVSRPTPDPDLASRPTPDPDLASGPTPDPDLVCPPTPDRAAPSTLRDHAGSTVTATPAPPHRTPDLPQAPPTVAPPAAAPGLSPNADGDGPEPWNPAGAPTRWGGLVYLLATAAEAEMPQRLFHDEELAGKSQEWLVLHLLAAMVGMITDDELIDVGADPATRALAGLPPTIASPPPQPLPTPTQQERLRDHAAHWLTTTLRRLDPAVPAPSLLRRTGQVSRDGGWIEFRLALRDIDIAVRRAGLDLDPGYVPWLGAVVVIRYE